MGEERRSKYYNRISRGESRSKRDGIVTQAQGQAEALTLSLLMLFLLFWICQSLSLIQRDLDMMTVTVNVVYLSDIILMIFNFGAIRAVMKGQDLELWMNDEGIELVFYAIILSILMSVGSLSFMVRNGRLL